MTIWTSILRGGSRPKEMLPLASVFFRVGADREWILIMTRDELGAEAIRVHRIDRHGRNRFLNATGVPAIQWRFSGHVRKAEPDRSQRQETQIVQSCMTLDDFLPGFRPQVICRPGADAPPHAGRGFRRWRR